MNMSHDGAIRGQLVLTEVSEDASAWMVLLGATKAPAASMVVVKGRKPYCDTSVWEAYL